MPLLDSPPQIPSAGAWGSLYAAQEPVMKAVVPAATAANKKPASYGYGGRKKNLELCTEALGCETGAVDAALPACDGGDDKGGDGEVEEADSERAERKRRAREEEMDGMARQAAWHRRPLPPPLTTLARGGASRVRMVHERCDGRLAVYAVRAPGVEAMRSGGRLRMRLVSSLPSVSGSTACRRQEPPQEAAEAKEEEGGECGVAMYVRGGRCVEPEGVAVAAARRGKQWDWEQEQAAAFWVATS